MATTSVPWEQLRKQWRETLKKQSVDCPACPKCGLRCGTPVEQSPRQDIHMHDPTHNLFCPACGHSWAADVNALRQGWVAWAAWEELEHSRG